MRAVELAKQENVGFLLAVGGGSVIDGRNLLQLQLVSRE